MTWLERKHKDGGHGSVPRGGLVLPKRTTVADRVSTDLSGLLSQAACFQSHVPKCLIHTFHHTEDKGSQTHLQAILELRTQ